MNRPVPMSDLERARLFLRDFFAAHPEGAWVSELRAAAAKRSLGYQTINRVANEMNVQRIRGGHRGAIWRPRPEERRAT
jgi:hypothetical protein